MRTLRIVRAIVLCALGVGLATSTALAAGPIKSPAPTPPDYPFMCGDQLINAHAVVNGNIKIFTARDGTTRVMFNGRFETILTRVSDGTTFKINSNGPATITIPAGADFPSTIAARGQTSYFTRTRAWQYTGLVMIDPMTGNVISHTGNVTDLCLLFQ